MTMKVVKIKNNASMPSQNIIVSKKKEFYEECDNYTLLTKDDIESFEFDIKVKEAPVPTESIICFTDGSCINNGNVNSRGAYAVLFPENMNFTNAKPLEGKIQTNNRAEFSAFILACESANIIDPVCKKQLLVYTDSMLLKNTVEKFIPIWRKKGWKKTNGSKIMNLDLVMKINDLISKRNIVLKYVRAHTTKDDWESNHNRIVDSMARNILKTNLV